MVWTAGFDTDTGSQQGVLSHTTYPRCRDPTQPSQRVRPLNWGCVSSFRHVQMEAGNGIAPRKPRYERDGGTTHLLSLQMVARAGAAPASEG